MSRRLKGTLTALAGVAGMALLLTWGWPWLANTVRLVRLVREEPARVLPVPVEGVAPEELADGWGAPRSGGRRHEGIDIFALRGTPVVSVTRGVIVRKGWNRLGGERAVRSGRNSAEVGDWVEVGEILGFVGDTGNAKGTPTHLHYGIYSWNGEAMDPYPLLAPRGE